MDRQSKEESQIMWKLELETAKNMNLAPEHQKLIDVVSTRIEDYTLTYNEYVEDVAKYLESVSDTDDPKEVIKNMCNHLIQKYGSKEIRSGQSENGSSTAECSGIIGEDSNNGGTEILREQLAESTRLLEEV